MMPSRSSARLAGAAIKERKPDLGFLSFFADGTSWAGTAFMKFVTLATYPQFTCRHKILPDSIAGLIRLSPL